MAKRYKNETVKKSSPHRKVKNSRKMDKRKVLIFFVIIIILIAGYFIINNIRSNETNSEIKISNSDKKISSDVLVLNDLNNEVTEHFKYEKYAVSKKLIIN